VAAADAAQFRTEAGVRGDFTGAGFGFVATDEVTWPRSASLADDHARLRLRAVSVFELLGAEAVEAALPSLDDGPQYETSPVLVFRRP
jgi:hypothetical protein